MWWTQPKLALVILAVNGCFVLALSLAVPGPGARNVALLIIQVVLLALYACIARRLGADHLQGATRGAFDDNVWYKPWGRSADGFEYLTSHEPAESEGVSFYRHVLGPSEETREALYGAMSLWEGSRLTWHGETVSLALAVVSSTVLLQLAARLRIAGPTPPWLAATLLPACVLLLPEAIKVLLLKERLLRRGAVDRIAALSPRDAVDLGLQAEEPVLPVEFRRDVAWIGVVFLLLPPLVVFALATGPRIAAIGTVTLIAGSAAVVALFYGFRWFVVHRIPFITFRGPLEVSLALDMAHRHRAWFSFAMLLGLLYVITLVGMNDPRDLPRVGLTLYWLGYIVAITFGDQLAGYAGFGSADRFRTCLQRSTAKLGTRKG